MLHAIASSLQALWKLPHQILRHLLDPFRNLGRALQMAMAYRVTLLLSFVCSLGVALMWGANIGAVYPFVEVVLAGKSMHGWIDDRIATIREDVGELEAESESLRRQQATADPSRSTEIQRELSRVEYQLGNEREDLAFSTRLEPWIKDYLPSTPFQTLVLMVGFLIVGTIVKGVFLIGNMVMVARIGQRTILDMQNLFFRRTLDLDLATLGQNGTGDLVGRIRGETAAIGNAVTTLFGKMLREPLKMAACLTGAALLNWRLLLLSMIICPAAGYLMIRLASSTKRANRRSMEESAKLMNRLFQAITYIKIVKAFTMERHERRRFRVLAKEVYHRGMKIAWYGALFRLNNEVLGIGVICLSLLAGGYLVLNQEVYLFGIRMCDSPMTAGKLLTFYAFLIGASDPIRKMGDVYNLVQAGMVAADRVFPLIDRESRVVSPASPRPLPSGAASLTFENVTFSYDQGPAILKGISFEIPAGQSVAIVGANGAGKSTLVNLLPRFYDPVSGKITLDGIDLKDFKVRDLRRYVGCVTQQTMLFDDTVVANIRYGNPGVTEEQVIAASRQAQAHGFISQYLEDGYHTKIGEHGGRLSGGQRQRISLARAILRNPSLLILDEATSQIDPESEVLIHRALRDFIRGRTTIMITHRVSTLDLADRIMVMEEGRIADFGTHAELLARCPIYQRLRQSDLRESA